MAARKTKPKGGKPFDVTTKTLVETNPKDWLDFLGLAATEYEMVSADLSTVTTDADRLILVKAPKRYGVHYEFQASPERRMPDRSVRYNVMSEDKLRVPIYTVVFLLRPEADRFGNMTGYLERKDAQGKIYLTFHYQVVRVWQMPVDSILQGGLALLPLAPISDLSGRTPETIVREMAERIDRENLPVDAERSLWTSAYLLSGLTYKPEDMARLFEGAFQMKESSTYQYIRSEGKAEGVAIGIEEGRIKEAQNLLTLIGEGRLGKPSAATKKRIQEITSVERLENMGRRLLAVESWDDLLTEA